MHSIIKNEHSPIMKNQAKIFFDEGYNCAQSTLLAFLDTQSMDEATALKLSSVFGGGIAGTGHVCGAVTGSLMAIALKHGVNTPGDSKEKEAVLDLSHQFIERFKTKNKSIMCCDLLGYNMGIDEERQIIKTQGLTKSICPQLVQDASEIVDELLNHL
jgi:C_GCAxxG_C_C family probable redox protein